MYGYGGYSISAWAIGVARSTMVGNARALTSRMSGSKIPHAFCLGRSIIILLAQGNAGRRTVL